MTTKSVIPGNVVPQATCLGRYLIDHTDLGVDPRSISLT